MEAPGERLLSQGVRVRVSTGERVIAHVLDET